MREWLGFNLNLSGADSRKDGRAGEGDHGKSFQEDKQIPYTPGLQQVCSQFKDCTVPKKEGEICVFGAFLAVITFD